MRKGELKVTYENGEYDMTLTGDMQMSAGMLTYAIIQMGKPMGFDLLGMLDFLQSVARQVEGYMK